MLKHDEFESQKLIGHAFTHRSGESRRSRRNLSQTQFLLKNRTRMVHTRYPQDQRHHVERESKFWLVDSSIPPSELLDRVVICRSGHETEQRRHERRYADQANRRDTEVVRRRGEDLGENSAHDDQPGRGQPVGNETVEDLREEEHAKWTENNSQKILVAFYAAHGEKLLPECIRFFVRARIDWFDGDYALGLHRDIFRFFSQYVGMGLASLGGIQYLLGMVRSTKIEVVRWVTLVHRLRHEEEDQYDENAIETCADPVRPIPPEVL